jgi:phosphoglycerate dehydrogenase-like enzyme
MTALLPPNALFVNFGRGNLVKSGTYHIPTSTLPILRIRFFPTSSNPRLYALLTYLDDLIAALDRKDSLFGAALDVTDPEPLPDKHPLWTHPKVIVTPHVSGNTEGEMDIATQICVENVRRISEGEKVVNGVDFTRGY